MSIEYRLAELSEINEIVDHDLRHMKEPGFNGTLAHPFPLDFPWDRQKRLEEKFVTLSREVTEEGWAPQFHHHQRR